MPILQRSQREIDNLYQAVLALKSIDEARRFFRDLMTREEINEMAARWQAARLVEQAVPYRVIAARTGMSTTTVARVADWLRNGKGGYRLLIDRLASASSSIRKNHHRLSSS